MASALKPTYLIHGDDHAAVAERRAGLRALLEGENVDGTVEIFEGDDSTPAKVALALRTLTISMGRRVLIVDGVEHWKQAEVEEDLAQVLGEIPDETTVALFAREAPRAKAPGVLHQAVERGGGQVITQMTVKPWELPRWARERASRMGIALDTDAAKALVGQVGDRPQRLVRELEKLALELGDAAEAEPLRISAEQIELRAAHSSASQAFTLADLLLRGETATALLAYVRLRGQGERTAGMVYLISQRLRDALAVSSQLQAGTPIAAVKRTLRMPPRVAERFVADIALADPERLRAAVCALAELELDTRGGSPVSAWRSYDSGLREDARTVRAIEAMTA